MKMDTVELEVRFAEVLRIAERRLSTAAAPANEDMYRLIQTNFDSYLKAVRSGGALLLHFGKGYGLGAGRALSDSGLDDDEMWTAISRAEQYFRSGE